MCNVDQRMAPSRHFNQAIGAHQRVVVDQLVAPESQSSRLVLCNVAHFSHFLQRLCQLSRIVDIQIHAGPFFGNRTPLHQRLGLQTGFDR